MTKKILLGAMDSDAPGDIITLLGGPPGTQYESLQTKRGPTGAATTDYYQVPTGYELVITKVYLNCSVAGGITVIGYGDAAVAAGVSAPTNAVGLTPYSLLVVATGNVLVEVPVCLVVPAGKYPYAYDSVTTGIMVSGFLHRT